MLQSSLAAAASWTWTGLAREILETLLLVWGGMRWLIWPRFERAITEQVRVQVAEIVKPLEEKVEAHAVAYARFPDTLDRLDGSIERLAETLTKIADKVDVQGRAQERMSGQVELLVLDRRSGHGRRADDP